MDNLTLSLKIIKPHTIDPLEGHTVVIFEQVGDAGEEFRFQIEPGQMVPQTKRNLFEILRGRKPRNYFSYAVTALPELHWTFTTDVTLDIQAHSFTLLVTLAYSVSEPRLLVTRRNDDPIRKVGEYIDEVLARQFAQRTWGEIRYDFRVVEHEVVAAILDPVRQFAAYFGLQVHGLALSHRLQDKDFADILEAEAVQSAKERTEHVGQIERASAAETVQTEKLTAELAYLKAESIRCESVAFDSDGARLYTVWYGTNREPCNRSDHSAGFTTNRDIGAMHYGSCRVVIPHSHKFGSVGTSWYRRFITLSDDRLHIRDVRPCAEAEFWDSIRNEIADAPESERQALVYLHGFNVTFKEAAIRAAQIGFDLKIPGVTAFFGWPSVGSAGRYPDDEASIEASESAITEFLVQFARSFGTGRVHVIAHSMGNRGLLRAMQRIHADAQRQSDVKFGQIILAAPDVDADTFRDLAVLYPRSSQRTTLYVSPSDKAVELSRWFHGAARAGFTPPVTIVAGIDTVEIPDFDLDLLGHSYYAEAAGVLHDIFDLVRYNQPPLGRQRLHVAKRDDGERYWTMLG